MRQKTVHSFPLTLALSPRGKRVKLENQLRGRGDNRKKIHSIISDRVKYNYKSSAHARQAGTGRDQLSPKKILTDCYLSRTR